jgi:DNA invertase Pin-like site-specific DNA recombinase/histone H3/H4
MPLYDLSPIPAVDTIGYVRVSTEQQAGEERTSLAEQRRAIAARATQLGRVLDPRAVFEDAGVSGATAERRPAFMGMLAYCEQHPRPRSTPGLVLVLNDSRFGRFEEADEATHWRFVLKRLGWHVRFCEGDDLEDGLARSVMRLVGSEQASEYRRNLKRTARRAARATAQLGRWQNEAPLGYRRLATRATGEQRVLEPGQRKSSDEVVRLTLGPEREQQCVRLIFEAYLTGEYSAWSLCRELEDRYGGLRRWSPGLVHSILKNYTYVGDVVWCRRPHDIDERREKRVRERSEWVVAVDAHPPIISRAMFAAVRDRRALKHIEKRATSGGYPLSALIRCAQCGHPFTAGGGRAGPPEDPDRYRFYRDRGATPVRAHLQEKRCTGYIATLRKKWLEETVVREIAKVVSDRRIQSVIAETIDAAIAAASGNTAERAAAVAQELERLTAQRKRVVDAIAGGVLAEREAATSLSEIRARIATLEAEATRLRFNERRIAGAEEIRARLVTLAQDFAGQALKAGGAQLRELVRHWLADAVMDKSTRTLTLYIRKIPEVLGMPTFRSQFGAEESMTMGEQPAPVAHGHTSRGRKASPFIVRRITVPDSPLVAQAKRNAAAKRRRAGGGR